MKKVLKIIGIVLVIGLILVVIFLKYQSSKPVAPVDYQEKISTGGPIEAKYMANGPYEVSEVEQPALQNFKKYVLFYPSELESTDKQYPVIVLCNGSGTPVSKYPAVARHYASWGFIVIGTEELYAWDGFGAEMCLRHLERLNDSKELEEGKTNIFYHKIDLANVGIVGHSQGGVGVFNAVNAQAHGTVYKAAVSLSPTNKELAHNLEWDYDPSLMNIPVMLISGEGGGDDWVVTGEQLKSIYDDIRSDKLMMRRKDTVHNEVLYAPDGYTTAWFMWHLQGDSEAAKAFTGDSPEIRNNTLYQDIQTDL